MHHLEVLLGFLLPEEHLRQQLHLLAQRRMVLVWVLHRLLDGKHDLMVQAMLQDLHLNSRRKGRPGILREEQQLGELVWGQGLEGGLDAKNSQAATCAMRCSNVSAADVLPFSVRDCNIDRASVCPLTEACINHPLVVSRLLAAASR